MTGDIIDFIAEAEKIERMCWVCNGCNNASFMLFSDGAIECAECHAPQLTEADHSQIVAKWTRVADEESE